MILIMSQVLYNFNRMRPGKTTHIFEVGSHSVKFSGNFDSGNLRNVRQIGSDEFQIEPAYDSYEFPSTNKAFFHFSVEDFPLQQNMRLIFKRVALLQCLKEDAKRYRPFYSLDGQNYSRCSDDQVKICDSFQGPVLQINLKMTVNKIFIAFSLPYSYERYLNMVRDLPVSDQQMYIHKQVLCYSNNLNQVYMISVTSQSRVSDQDERICQNSNGIILPQKHLHNAKKYFQKPVILLSSRVHPGQTSSSWAMEGIIKFITSQQQQAKLLRKHFQIVIVPMLNPDGVQQGLYRLDTRGYNLNRYYLISDNRQPSIYCMKHLIRHYHQTKRLLYYFDLHGHPSQKGSFLYGNALDQLPFQVQTQLFARLLSQLSPTFQQKFCIFDRQQMNAKDKNDMYTKQGCARVFTFRLSNIIHSYTMQMGFHGLSNPQSPHLYDSHHYYQEGRSILKAVLISCGLKDLAVGQTLHSLRKQLAMEICNRQDRFRKEERHLQQKKQNVNEIVEGQYWQPIFQQHFPEVAKPKKINMPHHKLKLPKRDSLYLNLQSFYSQQILQRAKQCEGEERTSLCDMLQQPKVKLQTTNITFKLHRTTHSLKSTNLSTKSDLQQKIIPNKLVRLLPTSTSKPKNESIVNGFRHKLKTMKRPIALRSIDQGNPKEEDHIFNDMNIRQAKPGQFSSTSKTVPRPGPRRNKIHSLFIETQS